MTLKQFLKSQTFRCVIVLLCIALVAGGLLSILNDVLYVSDEERTKRAIKKVYGQEMDYSDLSQSISENATNNYGIVDSLYLLADGNYLMKVTGIDGYKKGTITLYMVAEFSNGEFVGLKKVVLHSYEEQTLMSQFSSKFYEVYSENDTYVVGGGYFSRYANGKDMQNVSSGASLSSNAINNAVNCGLYYIRAELSGGQNG
ncbi:hypothetical protein EOM82_05715 [bacterium]|nr:hypothetical protein [bacterium]